MAFFARQLDGLKWQYHHSTGHPVLFCGFNGGEALWDFNMVARAKGDGHFLLGVNSFIPNKARPDRRAAVAGLLTRINWELNLGCFEMNYADGEIRFRTNVMAESTEEHLVPRSLLEACGVKYDNEHNMAVCCAGCNGLKNEFLPPASHPCWKSRKSFI